jgi:hypothetical protein
LVVGSSGQRRTKAELVGESQCKVSFKKSKCEDLSALYTSPAIYALYSMGRWGQVDKYLQAFLFIFKAKIIKNGLFVELFVYKFNLWLI